MTKTRKKNIPSWCCHSWLLQFDVSWNKTIVFEFVAASDVGCFCRSIVFLNFFFLCDFVNSLENIITLWAWVTPLLQMSRVLFWKHVLLFLKMPRNNEGKAVITNLFGWRLYTGIINVFFRCALSHLERALQIWCFCSEDSRGENDLRGENIVRETTREDRASEQQLLIEVFDPGHAAV